MPQIVTRFPTVASQAGSANTWTNPNNILSDDGTSATSTGTLLAASNVLSGTTYGLAGVIPSDATIVGIRGIFKSLRSANTLTHALSPGTGTVLASGTALAIVTLGYGTLSAGSTTAGGNTYNGNDLSTVAGGNAARAAIGAITTTNAGAASGALSTTNYSVDANSISVAWVVYRDRTDAGGAATGVGGGVKTVLVRKASGALATGVAAGQRSIALRRNSGAFSTGAAGANRTAVVVKSGGGSAADSRSGGSRTVLSTRAAGALATGAAGGTKRVDLRRVGGGAAAQHAGSIRTIIVVRFNAGAALTGAAGGARRIEPRKSGGATIGFATAAGVRRIIARRDAGAAGAGVGGGIGRLYTYGLNGITRGAAGQPITGVTVDVFRTNDNSWMRRTTSGVGGAWSIGLPSDPVAYWVRSWRAGNPPIFGTTDGDLTVIETLIQGPPL